MQLDDFVSHSLKQIIDGTIAAQEYASQKGAKVNPVGLNFRTDQGMRLWNGENGCPVDEVKFDIAVTVDEGTKTKGGVGVFVGAVGLGSQGQSDNAKSAATRIQFSIPLQLPNQK